MSNPDMTAYPQRPCLVNRPHSFCGIRYQQRKYLPLIWVNHSNKFLWKTSYQMTEDQRESFPRMNVHHMVLCHLQKERWWCVPDMRWLNGDSEAAEFTWAHSQENTDSRGNDLWPWLYAHIFRKQGKGDRDIWKQWGRRKHTYRYGGTNKVNSYFRMGPHALALVYVTWMASFHPCSDSVHMRAPQDVWIACVQTVFCSTLRSSWWLSSSLAKKKKITKWDARF